MQDLDSSQVIRFDLFELDFQEGALRQEGQRIKLQEQPFRILSLLVQSPGKFVTRDDLRRLLWPADTFVDFDHGLNSAVARLREALGDSASKPRFIETVAKKGYRFIGIADSGESAKQISAATPPVPKKSGWRRNRWRRVLATGTAFSTLFFAVGLAAFHRKSTGTTLASIEVTPLAGLRGFQITPAVSRDGSMVAFRQSDGTHNTGIFTSLIGGEISLEL